MFHRFRTKDTQNQHKRILKIINVPFLCIISFFIYIGFIDPHSLRKRYHLHQQIEYIHQQIESYNKQYIKAHTALECLEKDPKAIDNTARIRLFMKTDNEDVFVVEEQSTP